VSRFAFFISFVTLGLTFALTGCFEKPVAPVRNMPSTPAPEFSLQDFSGKTIDSSTYKGQIVVVNFWTTWSPGCSKELPELMQLQKKYQGKVSFIGIALGVTTAPDAQKMAADFALNYPCAVAPSEFHQSFGGIDAVPSSFVIDRQWNLVNRYTGRIRMDELSAELDYMLLPEVKN
jgi:thiol-disulfide isomerase/thioredoxin